MATLLTGGFGVIGAEVTRLLLERGEQRPALLDVNPSHHRLGDIAEQVDVIRGDLGTFSHVLDAVKRTRPTAIYHLGGMFSLPCEADPPAAIRVNALGTFHVLEAARLFDVPQVLFASSLATYGLGLGDGPIDDSTLQRPTFLYGATKLFGEHLGLFYRRKYGLDFRGLRYPGVVAPGVTTPGAAQYLSLLIEASARDKPFTVTVGPETRFPVMYVKDAARAMVELAAASRDRIQTVTYLLAGMVPVPSAGELVAVVRTRIPDAQIEFRPDPALQRLMDPMARPLADNNARAEWGWHPRYGLEEMVDDFLQELRLHPKRYNSASGAS